MSFEEEKRHCSLSHSFFSLFLSLSLSLPVCLLTHNQELEKRASIFLLIISHNSTERVHNVLILLLSFLFFELSAGKIVRTARYHQDVLRTDADKKVIETINTQDTHLYIIYLSIVEWLLPETA